MPLPELPESVPELFPESVEPELLPEPVPELDDPDPDDPESVEPELPESEELPVDAVVLEIEAALACSAEMMELYMA